MRKRNFPNSKASVMKVIKSCIGENGLDDERMGQEIFGLNKFLM